MTNTALQFTFEDDTFTVEGPGYRLAVKVPSNRGTQAAGPARVIEIRTAAPATPEPEFFENLDFGDMQYPVD